MRAAELLVGAALAAAVGYVAGRRRRLEEPLEAPAAAPAGPLEAPAAELDRPGELKHAWLAWDTDDRLWRSLVLLRCAEQSDNAELAARVRRGLASIGYRA